MNWFAYVLFGLIIGSIAKFIHPGRKPHGCFITVLLGISGSVFGRWIAEKADFYVANQFWNFNNWVASVAGSVLLLVVYNLFFSGRR